MPSHLETRMVRIEAAMDRHHPVSHHRDVVRVNIDEPDINAYLDALPCPCGAVACLLRTFGLVVPEILDVERWQYQAQQFHRERRDHA